MSLYETIIDYSQDVFRNIPSVKPSQNLFDDLSDDETNWDAANQLEMLTHPLLESNSLIQRGFEYSENSFIDYPFEHLTASRFSDGKTPCWYGSETLETTIYETVFHFVKNINDSIDAFINEKKIIVDRRVAKTSCIGLTIDLSSKTEEFPWLIDPISYTRCQEVGQRMAKEGHPLIRVKSVRHPEGFNIVAFKSHVLSNVREHCYLSYSFNLDSKEVSILRGEKAIMAIPA
ncbi:RES family NAD+ phosphorylase [Legionella sp. km772]|uniref:RES family NAD+ phosphorylase n=1 Tax=Legionella sp. km772 TaxID=2498111 RepID=UPI000F8DB089|nr:RES family NAD+ phosphorylase [Legionella sp. km772]RUR12959.1 RES domain-containing protein [Legionella sp. km772]